MNQIEMNQIKLYCNKIEIDSYSQKILEQLSKFERVKICRSCKFTNNSSKFLLMYNDDNIELHNNIVIEHVNNTNVLLQRIFQLLHCHSSITNKAHFFKNFFAEEKNTFVFFPGSTLDELTDNEIIHICQNYVTIVVKYAIYRLRKLNVIPTFFIYNTYLSSAIDIDTYNYDRCIYIANYNQYDEVHKVPVDKTKISDIYFYTDFSPHRSHYENHKLMYNYTHYNKPVNEDNDNLLSVDFILKNNSEILLCDILSEIVLPWFQWIGSKNLISIGFDLSSQYYHSDVVSHLPTSMNMLRHHTYLQYFHQINKNQEIQMFKMSNVSCAPIPIWMSDDLQIEIKKTVNPYKQKIIVATMVKDEDDIVEDWIIYHGNIFGFDNIYIYDNFSTDKTFEICKRYESTGIHIRQEKNYALKGIVMQNVMKESKCDIFIPLDIDEFIIDYDDQLNLVSPMNLIDRIIDYANRSKSGIIKMNYINPIRSTKKTDCFNDFSSNIDFYNELQHSISLFAYGKIDTTIPINHRKTYMSTHKLPKDFEIDHGNHIVTNEFTESSICLIHYHHRSDHQIRKKAYNNVIGFGHSTNIPYLENLLSESFVAGRHHVERVLDIEKNPTKNFGLPFVEIRNVEDIDITPLWTIILFQNNNIRNSFILKNEIQTIPNIQYIIMITKCIYYILRDISTTTLYLNEQLQVINDTDDFWIELFVKKYFVILENILDYNPFDKTIDYQQRFIQFKKEQHLFFHSLTYQQFFEKYEHELVVPVSCTNFEYYDTIKYVLFHQLPESFNLSLYQSMSKISSYNKWRIFYHFLNVGKFKNIIYDYSTLPPNFQCVYYKLLNGDLQIFKTDDELISHYFKYGQKENRKYSIDLSLLPNHFNPKQYQQLNQDLKHFTKEEELKYHYIRYGIKECRNYQ